MRKDDSLYYVTAVVAGAIATLFSIVFIKFRGLSEYGEYVSFMATIYVISGLIGFGCQWVIQRNGAKKFINLSLLLIVLLASISFLLMVNFFIDLSVMQAFFVIFLFFNLLFIDLLIISLGRKIFSSTIRFLYHLTRILIILSPVDSPLFFLFLFEVLTFFIVFVLILRFEGVSFVFRKTWLYQWSPMLNYYINSISGALLTPSLIVMVIADGVDKETLGALYFMINIFIGGYGLFSIFSRFEHISIRQYLNGNLDGFPNLVFWYELGIILILLIATLVVSSYLGIDVSKHYFFIIAFSIFCFMNGSLKLSSFWFYRSNNYIYMWRIAVGASLSFVGFVLIINIWLPKDLVLVYATVFMLILRPVILIVFIKGFRKEWFARLVFYVNSLWRI